MGPDSIETHLLFDESFRFSSKGYIVPRPPPAITDFAGLTDLLWPAQCHIGCSANRGSLTGIPVESPLGLWYDFA